LNASQLDQALAQLEGSVAAYPNDPAPWHDLGLIREHESDSRGAIEAFEHAVALARTDWRPRLAIAALLSVLRPDGGLRHREAASAVREARGQRQAIG